MDFNDEQYERRLESPTVKKSLEDPSSVWAWIFLFALCGLLGIIHPILGPGLIMIVHLIIAFSDMTSISMRNYARAVLVLAVVSIIIILVINAIDYINIFL